MTKRTGLVCAGVALALAAARPAGAIDDVTGTYEGKITCRQIAAGVATKTKQDVVVLVDEGKGGFVGLDVVVGGDPLVAALQGQLEEDAAKTDRAQIGGLECGLDFFEGDGATVHTEIVIKAGSEKGKMKGTVIDLDEAGDRVALCTFTAKRTSTAVPDVSLCL